MRHLRFVVEVPPRTVWYGNGKGTPGRVWPEPNGSEHEDEFDHEEENTENNEEY